MKPAILLILILAGCTPKAGLKLNEYGLGLADTDFVELMFKDVKYDGTVLEGRIELHALDDVEIPNIVGWRTLILDRAWTCDTFEDVALAHADYPANPDNWQDVLRLRKGDFYGRLMTFPVSLQEGAGPECIRYEVVYAPDGQFRGYRTTKVAGMVKRTPPTQHQSP